LFQKEVIEKDAPLKEYISSKFLDLAGRNFRNENLWRLYSLNAWLEMHL
jgi:hypothetical protein